MIIKLTTAGTNEAIYVNFDFVRTMRRGGAFTELTMSDDKYHKLAIVEMPEVIYAMLYPPKSCGGNCHCHEADKETILSEATAEEAKKPTTKKTSGKTTTAE